METAVSCLPSKWHHGAEPIPFGSEQRFDLPPRSRCHDCNVQVGGYHHYECDVEECPVCHRQALSCEHSVIEQPWDDGDYRLGDVIELTGAKRSQIENWARSGWLIPEGSASSGTGDARLFSFRNLVDIAIGVRLSRFHIPLRTLFRDLEFKSLRDFVPNMSEIEQQTDEQLVRWYTEGWTDRDWDDVLAGDDPDSGPLTREAYIADAIIARHRDVARKLRDLMNPARRGKDAYEALVISSDEDGKYGVHWHDERGGVHDCGFVINLATILQDLEDATGDEWGTDKKR